VLKAGRYSFGAEVPQGSRSEADFERQGSFKVLLGLVEIASQSAQRPRGSLTGPPRGEPQSLGRSVTSLMVMVRRSVRGHGTIIANYPSSP
jgi:hypothetical protein